MGEGKAKAMNSMMKISNQPTVHLYVRWSTDIQKDGDSNRRQLELGTNWCASRNIVLPPENIMKDEGVSAFRGKNIQDGKLGEYLASVKAGKIVFGSSLLVENLDRLSRQDAFKTMATIIYELLQAGIILVTLDTGKEYKWPLDFADMVTLSAMAGRGNGESERKKMMLTKAWKNKRDEARNGGKKLSSICPAWLKLSDDRMSFDLIPSRVAIVQRIFRMSMDGLGIHKITQTLNREKIEPFNGGGRAGKNPRGTWANSSVNSILSNRAVFGEFQMKIRTHEPNKRGKANDGEPVQGYYPTIISEADFNASTAVRTGRMNHSSGRKGKTLSNLFTGIAACSECGGKMHQRLLGTYKSKNPEVTKRYKETKILYCSETVNGNCASKSWDYREFEDSFLTFMRTEVDVDTIIKGGTGTRIDIINGELQQLDGERQAIQSKVNRLLDLDDDDDEQAPMGNGKASPVSISIKAKLATHDARLEQIISRVSDLNQERVTIIESRASANEIVKFTGFPVNLSESELYDVRAKTAQQIRSVVESIHLYRPNLAKRARIEGLVLYPPQPKNDPDARFDRRYVVRFHGGATRTIFPDGNNSEHAFIVLNFGFDPSRADTLPTATRTAEEFAMARAE
ncbi:recombinase family protein [Mesorhizobium sp. M0586]|uniref:recombinase family protein n=1 Tax=unclassified Mesorhizobium TaxID=325217 RepID=UPI00333685E3